MGKPRAGASSADRRGGQGRSGGTRRAGEPCGVVFIEFIEFNCAALMQH